MRGITSAERELLEDVGGYGPCLGRADAVRPYSPGEHDVAAQLLAQGRLAERPCACGYRHFAVTAEGREAVRLDALLRVAV